MNSDIKISLILLPIMALAACGDQQTELTPRPEPAYEVFPFDLRVAGLECDRNGIPHILVREVRELGRPGQPDFDIISHIYRFEGDSLSPVFTDLPLIEEFSPGSKNVYYGISSDRKALIKISQEGLETLYRSPSFDKPFIGQGIITNVLIDLHQNIWITLYGMGLARINGDEILEYNTENSGILSNNIISMSVDQSNTLWLGHLNVGISRILDNGSIDVITGFTLQNIYSLAPDMNNNMLLGLGWGNNDTILYRIGDGRPVDISPELHVSYPDTMLIIPDIAVDFYNRIWINVVYAVNLEARSMDLYYFDTDWKEMYLHPWDREIIAVRSDVINGFVYVLTTKSLYRIK